MKDEIAIKLTSTVGDAVPFFYSEAEDADYPFAVYDLTTLPALTKDGIHHFTGDVTINIVNDELDPASAIAETIKTRVAQQMNDDKFSAYLQSSKEECTSGIWSIELKYTIKQNK